MRHAPAVRWFVGVGMLLAGCCFLSVGCSQGGYSGPTGTVSGTVTREGNPLPAGCRVSFISDEGYTASGVVGANGSYQLSDVDKSEIPVATYKASVTPPPQAELSEAEYEAAMASGTTGTAPEAAEIVPEKYQNPLTTDLSYEVKAGPNTINIELP